MVDDMPIHRLVLVKGLQKLGIRGIEANGPEAALAVLREHRIHTVFLDWNFPDGTGEALARHVQAHHPSIRLIVRSADSSETMLATYRQCGARHVLGKNAELSELSAALGLDEKDPAPKSRAQTLPFSPAAKRQAVAAESDALHAALSRQNTPDARRAAHNLHGLGNLLGFDEIALLGREINLALHTRSPLPDLLTALAEALRQLPANITPLPSPSEAREAPAIEGARSAKGPDMLIQ